jgi:hypothetical protein
MQGINLTAGAATLEFHQGNLRHIKVGDSEIIRSIYFAVRDENWGTLPCAISSFDLKENAHGFEMSFVAEFGNPLVFKANCGIEGENNGRLTYTFDGEMHVDFKRNRIGFCVLHPIKECAGQPCTIIHPDKTVTGSRFPELISPHQPFKAVSAMRWNVGGTSAALRFEGDIFETEGQRNWTDASYKTYCTPLEIPFPVLVKMGDRITQKVVLEIVANQVEVQGVTGNSLFIDYTQKKPLPPLGAIHRCKPSGLTNLEIERLKETGITHLRYDVRFNSSNWKNEFPQLITDAEKLNCKLELCLHFDRAVEKSIEELMLALGTKSGLVRYVSILTIGEKATSKEHLDTIVPLIRKAFPNALVGAGTDYDFTDLNRYPVGLSLIDYVFYSACPQVHAFDDLSLIENLEGLAETVKSAKMLAPGKRVHVSAISLKRRSNPDATSSVLDPKQQYLKSIDERQGNLFGAAWTAGALKQLWENGADLITLFESMGPRGIMMNEEVDPMDLELPISFPEVFPVFNLLKTIAQFNPTEIVKTHSSNPLEFGGMLLRNKEEGLLFVFNFSAESKSISIHQGNTDIKVNPMSIVCKKL